MVEKIFADAINEAIAEEMRRDPNVFIMGEDIRLSIYGATKNLYKEFGEERVLDTPLSENGFFGAAIGASLVGMRPIVETVTTLPDTVTEERTTVTTATRTKAGS